MIMAANTITLISSTHKVIILKSVRQFTIFLFAEQSMKSKTSITSRQLKRSSVFMTIT